MEIDQKTMDLSQNGEHGGGDVVQFLLNNEHLRDLINKELKTNPQLKLNNNPDQQLTDPEIIQILKKLLQQD